ncbi:MAG: WYL domain-containing protein [Clostridia bacterium]
MSEEANIVKLTTSDGKAYGNRLIMAIIYTLKNKSTKEEPISICQLGNYVFGTEDYENNKGDRDKSMQRALLDLKDVFEINYELKSLFPISEKSNYTVKRNKWQLYYNQNLSESELNVIILSLLQSNCFDDYNADNLIGKIIDLAGISENGFAKGRLENVILTEWGKNEKQKFAITDVIKTMDFLYNAITCNKIPNKISFVLYGYNRKGERTAVRNGYKYTVSPLYLAVHGGRFWLLAKTKNYENISFYPLDLIGDLKELECEESEHIQNFNRKKFLNEHMNLSYDEPKVAYIKFHKYIPNTATENVRVYTKIYNTFGKDFQYSDKTAEKLGENWEVIKVTRSPFGLINWVLSNSEDVSLILNEELVEKPYISDTRFIAKEVEKKLTQIRKAYE